jgi:epsilon-lactone hydrolase
VFVAEERPMTGGAVMETTDPSTGVRLPARDVPIPASISDAARAVLAFGARPPMQFPALDDAEGWRALARHLDAELLGMLAGIAADHEAAASIAERDIGDVPVFTIDPHAASSDDRIVLDIHGGALISGGGPACRAMATLSAARTGLRTWSVDYRMPPDHPYPAAVDDCLRVYRSLVEDHPADRVVVMGTSAGGNLAAALIVRARDEGLPLPAAAVLLTPEVDLTESGDSFHTLLGLDTTLTASLMPANLVYAGGTALHDPGVSPLFADFAPGFVPTLIQSGTRDLFLSNAVRMHRALRRADVDAELHVLEAAPHGGFGGTPEDDEIGTEIRRFIARHCAP